MATIDPWRPPADQAPEPEPPPIRIASSLSTAGPRDLVYVDRQGRAMSGWRASLARHRPFTVLILWLVSVGLWGWLYAPRWVAGTVLSTAERSGPMLLVIAIASVALLAAFLRTRGIQSRQQRGLAYMQADELDAAERVFREELERPFLGRPMRGVLSLNLAAIASRRPQPLEQWQLALQAQAFLGGWRARFLVVYLTLARHAEIDALTSLGRLDEASAKLSKYPVPKGDFLLVPWAVATLRVQFLRGTCTTDDATLAAWSALASRTTFSGGLCVLLAWAQRARGREGDARLLVARARQLLADSRWFERAMPEVAHWLSAQPA